MKKINVNVKYKHRYRNIFGEMTTTPKWSNVWVEKWMLHNWFSLKTQAHIKKQLEHISFGEKLNWVQNDVLFDGLVEETA